MPKGRDMTMLTVDLKKFSVAMARAEVEPKQLAELAGVSTHVVYVMRRGCLVKPIYIGKVAKALNVDVLDILPEMKAGDNIDTV